RLDVNDIEAEFVLLYDAVHASVADPPEGAAHLDPSAAVAHAHQKIDDEPLEEGRTERVHPHDDVARQLGVEGFEARGHRLLRMVPRAGFLDRLRALGVGSPGDEFRIALERPEVDLALALGKQLAAAVSRTAVPAS